MGGSCLVVGAERIKLGLEGVGEYYRPSFPQREGAHLLQQGIPIFGSVHVRGGRGAAYLGVREAGFFGVDAAAEGYRGGVFAVEVACRVDVVCSSADPLVALALHVPGFALVVGALGVELDVAHLQYQLDTAVPVFLFEVDEDGGVVASVLIEVAVYVSAALFGWSEWSWFQLDDGITINHCQVEALVSIARGFEIDEGAVEEREESVDESFRDIVERAMVLRMDVVDVALDAARRSVS